MRELSAFAQHQRFAIGNFAHLSFYLPATKLLSDRPFCNVPFTIEKMLTSQTRPPRNPEIKSTMCKWTRPFWGTGCRRSPKSLSSAQAASLCSAGIESSKVLAGLAFCEMPSQYPLSAFQALSGVPGGAQQQFVTQTLCVHLLGIDRRYKK